MRLNFIALLKLVSLAVRF